MKIPNGVIRAIVVLLGFIFANFMYQAITAHEWGVAVERSYFQSWIAIVIVIWLWYKGEFKSDS